MRIESNVESFSIVFQIFWKEIMLLENPYGIPIASPFNARRCGTKGSA